VLRPSSQTKRGPSSDPRDKRGKVIRGQSSHRMATASSVATRPRNACDRKHISHFQTIERRERLMRCMAHARAIHGRWPPWRTVLPAC
jgi:hypothetical protein